jgi:hypothetical protein
LDVLGLSKEGLVAGECKFTSGPISEGVLSDLERTTEEVQWADEPTDAETLYVLFSRSGYTDDLKQAADARTDIELYDLPDVLAVL